MFFKCYQYQDITIIVNKIGPMIVLVKKTKRPLSFCTATCNMNCDNQKFK